TPVASVRKEIFKLGVFRARYIRLAKTSREEPEPSARSKAVPFTKEISPHSAARRVRRAQGSHRIRAVGDSRLRLLRCSPCPGRDLTRTLRGMGHHPCHNDAPESAPRCLARIVSASSEGTPSDRGPGRG